MTFLQDIFRDEPQVTTSQQWSNYLTILWGGVALLVILNVRAGIFTASSTYVNNEAGIQAIYPGEWLLDERGDYVFRVRDAQQVGFSTTFQVSLQPISPNTTPRTVVDTLALQRAQTLAAYSILATEPRPLTSGLEAQQVTYTYVATESNPFLEQIPTVVIGIDVVAISRGQAVIITMLSSADQLAGNQERFAAFVDQLEF